MKKCSEEIESKIIQEYLSGKSCKEVASIFGYNSVTVFNILKRNNIQTRTKGGIYRLPIENIVEDYKSGVRILDIAKKYNVNEKTIYNYLEKANIERNKIYININLKRDYFRNINSYDKAYFLGFMISDGNVAKESNNIALSLQYSDSYILEIFRQKTLNENPLYISNRNEATFHCKSSDMKLDLSKYGVVPNKSLYTFLPVLNDESLMNHLIRGIFDGNGWITVRPGRQTVGFCAGNNIIISQIRDYLVYKLDLYNVSIIHNGENVYSCQWSSKLDVLKICDFIYYNKLDCYLQRKFDKFMVIPR